MKNINGKDQTHLCLIDMYISNGYIINNRLIFSYIEKSNHNFMTSVIINLITNYIIHITSVPNGYTSLEIYILSND